MNEYIQIMLNAVFIGIGSAIGNYLANQHLIKRLEELRRKNDNSNRH